jgi:hypothetical protein
VEVTACVVRHARTSHFAAAPSSPRKQGCYAGLFNQGNTCYLNSLIQGLYATPEVRTALYSLTEKDLIVETGNEAEPDVPTTSTSTNAPSAPPSAPGLTPAEKEALELLTGMVSGNRTQGDTPPSLVCG